MTKLSGRENEFLDIVLYLRHKIPNLIETEQREELEAFLAKELDDSEKDITPETITELLKVIQDHEPVRKELEALASSPMIRYEGPTSPKEEAPIIPLGATVICPQKDKHDPTSPFRTGTRLGRQGQRCPVHNVFLVPLEGEKD